MTSPTHSRVVWDAVGSRTFETGVDRGVLYVRDNTGAYPKGVAWSGLTGVTETPGGAAATPLYADNTKYLNLISVETLDGTITAYTYPDEWAQCDGTEQPSEGVSVGQQGRATFGLSYRTRLGNDVDGTDFGYKLHLLYGAIAAPSARAYATINDTPAAIDFSWGISTTAVDVPGLKPTSLITINSSKVSSAELSALEDALYGSSTADAHLPLPTEVLAMFTGATG